MGNFYLMEFEWVIFVESKFIDGYLSICEFVCVVGFLVEYKCCFFEISVLY